MDYLYNLKIFQHHNLNIPLLRDPIYYNLSSTSSFSVEKSASCNHKSFVSKVINQGLFHHFFNTSQTSDTSVCLLSNILFAIFMKLYFFVVFTQLFNKRPLLPLLVILLLLFTIAIIKSSDFFRNLKSCYLQEHWRW